MRPRGSFRYGGDSSESSHHEIIGSIARIDGRGLFQGRID